MKAVIHSFLNRKNFVLDHLKVKKIKIKKVNKLIILWVIVPIFGCCDYKIKTIFFDLRKINLQKIRVVLNRLKYPLNSNHLTKKSALKIK